MKIYKQMQQLFSFDIMIVHATFMYTFMTIVSMLMASYVAKNVGLYIPMSFLVGIQMGGQISGMLLVYVKLGLARTSVLFIGVRFIQYFLLILLALDVMPVHFWIYTVAGLGVVRGLIDSAYQIEYENMIAVNFTEDYKEIQYTERTIYSVCKFILGFGVLVLYGAIDLGYIDVSVLYGVVILLNTISLAYQVWFHNKYITKVDL